MEKPIAIILAAGRGTRMGSLTESLPKPLLCVRGKPILTHVLEGLAPHVSRIVLVVGYLQDMIIEQIGSSHAGVPITYVNQVNPKGGTLEAFRLGVGAIEQSESNGGYIVVSADDIHAKETFHQLEKHAEILPNEMLLTGMRLENPEELKRFGVFVFNEHGKVTSIEEKPLEPPSVFINCALYYFPPAFLELAFSDIEAESNGELYLTEPVDRWIRTQGADFYEVPSWEPVGTPQDLEKANEKQAKERYM